MHEALCQAVIHTRQKLGTSEHRICAVLGVARSSLRDQLEVQDDEVLGMAMPAKWMTEPG